MIIKKSMLALCIVGQAHGILNPLTYYTPLTVITNTAQIYALSSATNVLPTAVISSAPVTETSAPTTNTITNATLGQAGQTVTEEGSYQVSHTISYVGSGNTTCALRISESNVIIDLNGQTICYSGDRSRKVDGIYLAPGVTNITIQNGTICNFTGSGISASERGPKARNHITLHNLKISSCSNGIIICQTNNVTIANCAAIDNQSSGMITSGFQVDNSAGILIQECISQNNKNQTGACYGFFLSSCKSASLYTCIASSNEGLTQSAGIYFLQMNNNNYIESCTSNGNSSLNGPSHGYLLQNCFKTFIRNSKSACNYVSSPESNSYGIKLVTSSVTFIKANTIDCNDYGIYDDEPLGQQTNIFTQNIAHHNTIADYIRPFSSPLTYVKVYQEHLQGALIASALDNISVRIHS